ncbi:aldolase/citrate lyase family protein, partial [Streptomyces sp. SID724]|uniref:DUF6986 family protein n=1 Tax=Streptomyces sp. SID724 TaxID=2690324 RepID=UPI001F0292C6
MGQQEKVATSLAGAVSEEISASLTAVDAELARRYPGDPGTRQPVHTVYVPGDVFEPGTLRSWGDRALAALDEHAPDAASFAAVLGISEELAGPVHDRVRAKLEREPVEDLRIDFEDGYGPRPDVEEDEAAARAARLVSEAYADGTAAPYMGIRMKCMEAGVRDRGIRTTDVFLTGLMEAGGLPEGLVLTLPKVTYPEQVTAFVQLLEAFEKAHGLDAGRIGFEIQIETSQSILAADGTAAVACMIDAARGRATGLHYGTFDYSACVGVSAAYQASDHPAADRGDGHPSPTGTGEPGGAPGSPARRPARVRRITLREILGIHSAGPGRGPGRWCGPTPVHRAARPGRTGGGDFMHGRRKTTCRRSRPSTSTAPGGPPDQVRRARSSIPPTPRSWPSSRRAGPRTPTRRSPRRDA